MKTVLKRRLVLTERLGEVVEHARDGLGLLLLGELPMLPLVLSAPLLVFERAAVVHSGTSMPNFF